MINPKDIFSVSLILFSVIDILGSLPVIISLKKQAGQINSELATLIAGGIMICFLFLGNTILSWFGLDIASFAISGAIIMFLIGMEMVLGINIFQYDPEIGKSHSVVPIAFPIIAGAGTMTTLISLRAEYQLIDILAGAFINLIFVYLVLKYSHWIEEKLGRPGIYILRKVFGIILLAIAIKLFKNNISMP